jgi:hypothetical protein
MRPPKRVHLPSGRAVALDVSASLAARSSAPAPAPAPARPRARPLFSELADLVASGELTLRDKAGAPVDVATLPLRDYHALRAIAMRLGWLSEEALDLACRNCGEPFRLAPCAALELGPFADGELDDDELDRTLDLSVAHAIPPVSLGADAEPAREATLRDVTVADAAPLHRALRRRRLAVTDRVVRAMGVASLGPERDPRRIAHALERSSDEAWGAIGHLFLQAHYPPRLCAIALCSKCGARHDVDAPYEREFDAWEDGAPAAQSNAASFPERVEIGEGCCV